MSVFSIQLLKCIAVGGPAKEKRVLLLIHSFCNMAQSSVVLHRGKPEIPSLRGGAGEDQGLQRGLHPPDFARSSWYSWERLCRSLRHLNHKSLKYNQLPDVMQGVGLGFSKTSVARFLVAQTSNLWLGFGPELNLFDPLDFGWLGKSSGLSRP